MKKPAFVAAALMISGAAFAQTASYADFTPRPASKVYPPCSGAESDDNCIQLYERGVSTSANLAMNERGAMMSADAGMATAGSATGVGGPYEPVGTRATGNWPERTMGDYPPCSGSPSDDRCIQLYERGVTGR